jgi:hypothetical protein
LNHINVFSSPLPNAPDRTVQEERDFFLLGAIQKGFQDHPLGNPNGAYTSPTIMLLTWERIEREAGNRFGILSEQVCPWCIRPPGALFTHWCRQSRYRCFVKREGRTVWMCVERPVAIFFRLLTATKRGEESFPGPPNETPLLTQIKRSTGDSSVGFRASEGFP